MVPVTTNHGWDISDQNHGWDMARKIIYCHVGLSIAMWGWVKTLVPCREPQNSL